jgi:hypothetical protein
MNDIATDNYVDHRECEKRARTGGAVDGVAFGPGVVAWDLGNSEFTPLSDAAMRDEVRWSSLLARSPTEAHYAITSLATPEP